jgi:hypothetical protein
LRDALLRAAALQAAMPMLAAGAGDSQHIGQRQTSQETCVKQSKIWNCQSALRRRLTSQ